MVRDGMRVQAGEGEYRTVHKTSNGWKAVDDGGTVQFEWHGNILPSIYEEVPEVDDFEAKVALAGLNNELATVRNQIVELERTHEKLEKQAAQLKVLLPPFEKGQKVRTPSKGVMLVDDVDQAFGGKWLVLGHFPGSPSKQYTYPAAELENY